jgi:hypothetical protein
MSSFFLKHNKYFGQDGMGKCLEVSNYLQELTHCGKSLSKTPVLVPPTWNKSSYHGALSKVWSTAAEELSEARNIYVFGYSLPESDSFFRYLFALGTLGSSRIRRFWVFDPDRAVEQRFQSLIGSGIRSRFEYYNKKFFVENSEGAMHLLQKELYPLTFNR